MSPPHHIAIQANDPIAEALAYFGGESLLQRLHFNAGEGRIWLDDRRMLLLDATAFNSLRVELVELLGVEVARGVLTRVGYLMGARDAELSWKIHGHDAPKADLLATGPFLHALEGFVKAQSVRRDLDIARGHCDCEFLWKHSVEHDAHIAARDGATDAACWMAVGHTSAYFSGIMGRRILVRELECEATGGTQCRAVARPVEQWDDPEEDLRYFTVEHIRPARHRAMVSLPAAALEVTNEGKPASSVVGSSSALTMVLHKVHRVARTNATVLLLGESGVGKSLFAREIHQHSKRKEQPFVAINCAAIPESLVESELFGVERGAYSGASQSRAGRFEAANGGTVFLDEIGTLTLPAQAKLLRVLQTGELERLGSTRTIKVNSRILAATNVDLQEAVRCGTFREDLYYRINVFPIDIPPLRDRRDDLPALLEACIARFCAEHDRHCTGVTARALKTILAYDWPGNIRELENVLERAVIMADDGEALDAQHLFNVDMATPGKVLLGIGPSGRVVNPATPSSAPAHPPADSTDPAAELHDWAQREVLRGHLNLPSTLNLVRDSLIRAAMEHSGGNVAKAAARLGVTRAQIDYRLKQA